MEINLISQTGFPEGCLLSVRAGSVRRQALASSGKPLRFPKIGMEENPVKIELLKTVATAYLIIKPGEQQYKVVFPDGQHAQMTCEVEVGKAQGEVDAAPAKDELTKPGTSSAKDAKDYLESHQLLNIVQALLQTVLREKPDKPYEYMARHLMSGYEPTDARSPPKASGPLAAPGAPAPSAEEKLAEPVAQPAMAEAKAALPPTQAKTVTPSAESKMANDALEPVMGVEDKITLPLADEKPTQAIPATAEVEEAKALPSPAQDMPAGVVEKAKATPPVVAEPAVIDQASVAPSLAVHKPAEIAAQPAVAEQVAAVLPLVKDTPVEIVAGHEMAEQAAAAPIAEVKLVEIVAERPLAEQDLSIPLAMEDKPLEAAAEPAVAERAAASLPLAQGEPAEALPLPGEQRPVETGAEPAVAGLAVLVPSLVGGQPSEVAVAPTDAEQAMPLPFPLEERPVETVAEPAVAEQAAGVPPLAKDQPLEMGAKLAVAEAASQRMEGLPIGTVVEPVMTEQAVLPPVEDMPTETVAGLTLTQQAKAVVLAVKEKAIQAALEITEAREPHAAPQLKEESAWDKEAETAPQLAEDKPAEAAANPTVADKAQSALLRVENPSLAVGVEVALPPKETEALPERAKVEDAQYPAVAEEARAARLLGEAPEPTTILEAPPLHAEETLAMSAERATAQEAVVATPMAEDQPLEMVAKLAVAEAASQCIEETPLGAAVQPAMTEHAVLPPVEDTPTKTVAPLPLAQQAKAVLMAVEEKAIQAALDITAARESHVALRITEESAWDKEANSASQHVVNKPAEAVANPTMADEAQSAWLFVEKPSLAVEVAAALQPMETEAVRQLAKAEDAQYPAVAEEARCAPLFGEAHEPTIIREAKDKPAEDKPDEPAGVSGFKANSA